MCKAGLGTCNLPKKMCSADNYYHRTELSNQFYGHQKRYYKKPWYWTLCEGEGAKWYYCKSHCLHLTRVFFPRFSFADSCSAFEMGKLC